MKNQGREVLCAPSARTGPFRVIRLASGDGQHRGEPFSFVAWGNMAMAIYKATWFGQDNTYQVGWTENWWLNAASASAAYAAVSGYTTARLPLMMNTAFFTFVRIANVDHPRDSQVTNLSPTVGSIVSATYPPAGPWDSLLVRRDAAANSVFGHMFLRSVPQAIFTGRTYVGSVSAPVWSPAYTTFQTAVTSGVYLLRQLISGTPSYPPCTQFIPMRRTERRIGRPFDALRGRRATA